MTYRLLVFRFVAAMAAAHAEGQSWQQADAATVRLDPAAFADLPAHLRGALERRGCVVPQSYSDTTPHNVVRGRFMSRTELDIAVLCSRNLASSILVFRGGSTAAVEELAERPDADFLQVVDSAGVVGYSRALRTADVQYVREHHRSQGGSTVPLLDHDGINDIFVGNQSCGTGPVGAGCSSPAPTEVKRASGAERLIRESLQAA